MVYSILTFFKNFIVRMSEYETVDGDYHAQVYIHSMYDP